MTRDAPFMNDASGVQRKAANSATSSGSIRRFIAGSGSIIFSTTSSSEIPCVRAWSEIWFSTDTFGDVSGCIALEVEHGDRSPGPREPLGASTPYPTRRSRHEGAVSCEVNVDRRSRRYRDLIHVPPSPRRNSLSQAGSFPDALPGNQYTASCRGLSPSTRLAMSALQRTRSPWRHEGLPPCGRTGTRVRPSLASSLRDELAFLGVGCGEVAPVSLRGKDYRDHGDERHGRRVRRDRPPAEAGEQGGSNERRQAAGEDRSQLVAQRSSGVAHPGAEELGEVGRLRSVHRVVTEFHAEDDGDPDQGRNARVQQPEERESEEQREGGPEQVHRTTSYAVGERPEKGDGNEPDGGGDYDADQARALLHSQLSFYVGEHEDGQYVEGPVLGDAHPHR